MREPGWYWVKKDGVMMVAEWWMNPYSAWCICGVESAFDDSEMGWIGPKIEEPKED